MELRSTLSILILLLSGLSFAPSTLAQLPEDVRDTFDRLVEDLDDDLSKKFRKALKEDSNTIEFTPEQFRRFRDNPANPFDGLDDVDARDEAGNIALKFELPSIRRRMVSPRERQHSRQLQELRPALVSVAASTVGVFEGDKAIALGIVVDSSGLIITKASEVQETASVICQLPNGVRIPASLVRTDERNDIAVLSVDPAKAGKLTPVRWSESQPLLGGFVIVPGADGEALSLGTFSSNVRSTVYGEQAFLGVQPQTTSDGVLVSDIRPESASYAAGLRDGDVIVRLDNQPIRDVSDLVYYIRTKRPGDRVLVEYLRAGAKLTTTAELAGRRLSGERAARFKMMSRLGAIPSRRADGFPVVFQHDAPLFPEQCGGPVVDLDGNVIGMNIARNGRDSTYAIPAAHLQTLTEDLLRSSLARRESPDSIQN